MTAPTPRQLRADIRRRGLTNMEYARLVPANLYTLRTWLYVHRIDEPIRCNTTTAARLATLVNESLDKESKR